MMRVVKFERWHMALVEKREGIYSGEPNVNIDVADRCDDPRSFIYTFVLDDQYLAVVGMTILWPGVADVWGVLTDKVRIRPLEFHKKCLGLLDLHVKKFNIHRLSTTVRADYAVGVKWARSLGFEIEGLMKMFGSDKTDYYMFARFD